MSNTGYKIKLFTNKKKLCDPTKFNVILNCI